MNAIAEPLEVLDIGYETQPPQTFDDASITDEPPRDPACGERVLAWTVERICACPSCTLAVH